MMKSPRFDMIDDLKKLCATLKGELASFEDSPRQHAALQALDNKLSALISAVQSGQSVVSWKELVGVVEQFKNEEESDDETPAGKLRRQGKVKTAAAWKYYYLMNTVRNDLEVLPLIYDLQVPLDDLDDYEARLYTYLSLRNAFTDKVEDRYGNCEELIASENDSSRSELLSELRDTCSAYESLCVSTEKVAQKLKSGAPAPTSAGNAVKKIRKGLAFFLKNEPPHDDQSGEYNAMILSLAAMLQNEMPDQSPGALRKELNTLRTGVKSYIDATQALKARRLSSAQEELRLTFAHELDRFCRHSIAALDQIVKVSETITKKYHSHLKTAKYVKPMSRKELVQAIDKYIATRSKPGSGSGTTLKKDTPVKTKDGPVL